MTSAAEHWDLVVVGAGPAGSAVALGALAEDPGLRVLVLDRSDFPRDKPCGDGIAPHVLDVLSTVGVTGIVDDRVPVHELTLTRGSHTVTGSMRRPAHVVPRTVFDDRLLRQALRAGARFRRHRVSSVVPGPDGVLVSGTLTGSVVVGADGAHSPVRRTLLGAPRHGVALALRGYVPTPPGLRGRQVIHFGRRRQPSYAWSFDRGDGLANVGYGELLPGRDGQGPPPSRRLLLDELDRLLPGVAGAGDGWRGHHLPLSGPTWPHPDGPVLLAGDAAGLVSPLTGEGIYYAVATGVAAGRTAARCLAAGRPADAGAAYRRAVRRTLGLHLRHTWAVSHLARAPWVVDAGIDASRRDIRVFDTLVDLGLGNGLVGGHTAAGLARTLVGSHLPARPPDRSPSR